jgi:hypothetical protein
LTKHEIGQSKNKIYLTKHEIGFINVDKCETDPHNPVRGYSPVNVNGDYL